MPKVKLLHATRYGGQGRAKGDTLKVSDDVANRWVNARHPLAELAPETVDLAKLKKAELVDLAKERGIDSEGTADELRERLGG